jgi:hypothetical protein
MGEWVLISESWYYRNLKAKRMGQVRGAPHHLLPVSFANVFHGRGGQVVEMRKKTTTETIQTRRLQHGKSCRLS